MRRGDLYRALTTGEDPRPRRVFVVVSRQALIDSRHSTVVCAPVFAHELGLETEVNVGVEHGLKRASSVHCDDLVSLRKALLTDYVGSLDEARLGDLDRAVSAAVGLSGRTQEDWTTSVRRVERR